MQSYPGTSILEFLRYSTIKISNSGLLFYYLAYYFEASYLLR